MYKIVKIDRKEDIFPIYQNTPISQFIEFHNFHQPQRPYDKAELLIGMCMDNRNSLRMPNNFAFIIRSGGANLRYSEFKVSYAISVGGVKHIALLGHTNCGMVNLADRKELFINGMVENAGWDASRAKESFEKHAPIFEIENEVDFVVCEAQRLREKYPKVTVVPMLYKIEDHLIYLINEEI